MKSTTPETRVKLKAKIMPVHPHSLKLQLYLQHALLTQVHVFFFVLPCAPVLPCVGGPANLCSLVLPCSKFSAKRAHHPFNCLISRCTGFTCQPGTLEATISGAEATASCYVVADAPQMFARCFVRCLFATVQSRDDRAHYFLYCFSVLF